MARTKVMMLGFIIVDSVPVGHYQIGTYSPSANLLQWEVIPPSENFRNTLDLQHYTYSDVVGNQYVEFDVDSVFNAFLDVAQITVQCYDDLAYRSSANWIGNYPFFGDYVFFYDLASFSSFTGSSGGTVDLTPISNQLLLVQDNINANILGAVQAINGYLGGLVNGLGTGIENVDLRASEIYTLLQTYSSFQNDTGYFNVNLAPVLDAITQQTVTLLHDVNVDLTPVINLLTPLQTAELNNLHEDIVSLGTQLSTATVLLDSLNGSYESFPDGSVVQIYPSSRSYVVDSSFFFRNDSNQFLIMYWLIDETGKKVSVPHNFLVIPSPALGV